MVLEEHGEDGIDMGRPWGEVSLSPDDRTSIEEEEGGRSTLPSSQHKEEAVEETTTKDVTPSGVSIKGASSAGAASQDDTREATTENHLQPADDEQKTWLPRFIRASSLPIIARAPTLLAGRARSLSPLFELVTPMQLADEGEGQRTSSAGPSTLTRETHASLLLTSQRRLSAAEQGEQQIRQSQPNVDLLQWAQLPPSPPRRNLRTRKPAQLAPYTTEMQRYRRRLVRNDWEDAVVVEREFLRAQREKRREREGGEGPIDDDIISTSRPRSKGKERQIDTNDGDRRRSKDAGMREQASSRAGSAIFARYGGDIATSSEDEGRSLLPSVSHLSNGGSPAASPSSASSSQLARPRGRKRHHNALLSDSESASSPQVFEVADSSSATESDDDEDDVRLKERDEQTVQREGDGKYTAEEMRYFRQQLRLLKHTMPKGAAKRHIEDLIAMHREAEEALRHPRADSMEIGDEAGQDSRDADTPETLRPGESRKRMMQRRDWAASRLIDDADEESDASSLPSPASSSDEESNSTAASSNSEDELRRDEDSRPSRDAGEVWQHRIYRARHDDIDRMLTSAAPRGLQTRRKKARRSQPVERQTKLTTYSAREKVDRSSSNVALKRKKKRSKIDTRHRGPAGYSSRALQYSNPPLAAVRGRPRFSLLHDGALFEGFTTNENEVLTSPVEHGTPLSSGQRSLSFEQIEKENESEAVRTDNRRTPQHGHVHSREKAMGDRGKPIDVDAASPLRPTVRTPLVQKKLNMESRKEEIVASPQLIKQKADMEIWHDVCDLRLDFGLGPPRYGLSFGADTYLGRGRLFELLELAKNGPTGLPSRSMQIFGFEVSPISSRDCLADVLSIARERLEVVLRGDTTSAEDRRSFQHSFADLVRLLTLRVTASADRNAADFAYGTIAGLLDTLRLDRESKKDENASITLLLRWYKVELIWRKIFCPGSSAPSLLDEEETDWPLRFMEAAQELMLELLIHGLHRTMQSIKTSARDAETTLDDVSARYWIGLLHLLGQPACSTFSGLEGCCSFWLIFDAALKQYQAALGQKSSALIVAENGWYCLFAVSSLSYISASAGNAISQSCIKEGYWPLVVQMLSKVRLRADEQVEATMSAAALQTRDAYIRLLLCRVHHLHTKWHWSFESSEGTLSRLFSLFDSHKLEDLPSESIHDFPSFLCKYDERLLSEEVHEGDSCFHIFVKLLARAAADARALSGGDEKHAEKKIARLFSRFSPLRTMAFSKEAPPTISERSGLYNHYSIALVYLYLVPASHHQRLLQIQQYLSFVKADDKSKLICIRAMMYAITVLQHHRLDIKEGVTWFRGAFKLLFGQYEELHRVGPATGHHLKWNREVKMQKTLLIAALRSMQYVIKTPTLDRRHERIDYPDLSLIDPTWTASLMQSQLAAEGTELAFEVCHLLQAFLISRSMVMPKSVPTKEKSAPTASQQIHANAGESQDSCADLFDDIDFDDALFLDAAEIAEQPVPIVEGRRRKEGLRAKDREFAQLLHDRISPAMFRLLSNLFHPERQSKISLFRAIPVQTLQSTGDYLSALNSAIKETTKTTLAEMLIDTWSWCAWITVEDVGVRQWSYYFNYGAEDPKRMQGQEAKRDVTLRFLVMLSSKCLDRSVAHTSSSLSTYAVNMGEFWTTFMASLPARHLTSQHLLCNNLRSLESRRCGGKGDGNLFEQMDWQEKSSWTVGDFEEQRLTLLRNILANLTSHVSRQDQKNLRALAFASVTSMLASVRVSLSDTRGGQEEAYRAFCEAVMQACRDHISGPLLRGVSSELDRTSTLLASLSCHS